jgi:glycerophosphoryl diester phosphodiesterase
MRYGFAHRGGSHGPDNAIATYVQAIALGARCLETDAWVTSDGVVVLDHDGLGNTGREPISQVRRSDLPAHMDTLAGLYETAGTDFELAVDVRVAATAAAVVAVADRYAATDRLWLFAAAPAELGDLEGVRRGITVRGNTLRSRGRARALAHAREIGVDVVNARWMWWSRAIVGEVHTLGMLAFGYDAQQRRSLDRAVAIGLDGIFCDHVERMLAAIAAGPPAG